MIMKIISKLQHKTCSMITCHITVNYSKFLKILVYIERNIYFLYSSIFFKVLHVYLFHKLFY